MEDSEKLKMILQFLNDEWENVTLESALENIPQLPAVRLPNKEGNRQLNDFDSLPVV